jgi:glycosyltransferase involved in cell wall biosynthesis
MPKPFFSIIIPTYNRANFIGNTIDSILQQTYTNYEIIVVDDGSTDNTELVVKSFLNNANIQYFKKENGERGAARNFGVLSASGDYITFLDSDDLIYPQHFSEATELLDKNPSANFFVLSYEVKTPEGKILSQQIHSGNLNQKLIEGNVLSCIGVFVKKEVLLANLFNEDRALAGSEDWELWMRMAAQFPIFYSPQITSAIINHESRSVLNVNEEKLRQRIDLAMMYLSNNQHFINYYGAQIPKIWCHLYLYISLHLVLAKKKKQAFYYAMKAFKRRPLIFFHRKFLVILRELIK